EDRLEPLQPVSRASTAAQLVVLAGEDEQFGLDPLPLEGGVIPLPLRERAAQIVLRVDDEGRGRDLVHERLRALRTDLSRIDAGVLIAEEVADVGGADEGLRIEVAALDDRRGEPVVLRDGPCGEISSVGAAHDPETFAVEGWIRGESAFQ